VRIPGKPAGKRIGVVKFYEAGYYSTTADNEIWTTKEADQFIEARNALNGISASVAESAMDASMFGWHVPAADEAIAWFRQWSLDSEVK